jgi:hypothetical protein
LASLARILCSAALQIPLERENEPLTTTTLMKASTLIHHIACLSILATATSNAQCPAPVFASGLRAPTKVIFSQKDNLLVAEQGTADPNTGRISIIDAENGARRTLLDGLPSALNLLGEQPAPSGPDGLAMRGRTLYVTIGSGNSTLPGPVPGSEIPNPNSSSRLFSSVLEVHCSAKIEMSTTGFTLSAGNRAALARGDTLTFADGSGGVLTVKLLTNFPDYIAAPRPDFPANVVSSNPFGVVVHGNSLDVVDASFNLIAEVNTHGGASSTLVQFANVPNTTQVGPPAVNPVPDSIRFFGRDLLVPYLTGFPFGPGAARVQLVDATTGANQPFITALTAAIDVLPLSARGNTASQFLVLEFGGTGLSQPGELLRFSSPTATPSIISPCLITPTSMVLDERSGALFITEIGTGNLIRLQL